MRFAALITSRWWAQNPGSSRSKPTRNAAVGERNHLDAAEVAAGILKDLFVSPKKPPLIFCLKFSSSPPAKSQRNPIRLATNCSSVSYEGSVGKTHRRNLGLNLNLRVSVNLIARKLRARFIRIRDTIWRSIRPKRNDARRTSVI